MSARSAIPTVARSRSILIGSCSGRRLPSTRLMLVGSLGPRSFRDGADELAPDTGLAGLEGLLGA
jgi:hypothetical protein